MMSAASEIRAANGHSISDVFSAAGSWLLGVMTLVAVVVVTPKAWAQG